jgi:hypothetical protein
MIIDVISGGELFSRWKEDRDGEFYPDPCFKKLMKMFLDPCEKNLQSYNKLRKEETDDEDVSELNDQLQDAMVTLLMGLRDCCSTPFVQRCIRVILDLDNRDGLKKYTINPQGAKDFIDTLWAGSKFRMKYNRMLEVLEEEAKNRDLDIVKRVRQFKMIGAKRKFYATHDV